MQSLSIHLLAGLMLLGTLSGPDHCSAAPSDGTTVLDELMNFDGLAGSAPNFTEALAADLSRGDLTRPATGAVIVGVAKDNGLLTGLGLLTASTSYAFARGHDYQGWESDQMTSTSGVSGAPLWFQGVGGPFVIGIQSAIVGGKMVGRGLAHGSRITAGACENMIRNFIGN